MKVLIALYVIALVVFFGAVYRRAGDADKAQDELERRRDGRW